MDIDDMLETAIERTPSWKTGQISFLRSLQASFEQRGRLTDRQIESLERICQELGIS